MKFRTVRSRGRLLTAAGMATALMGIASTANADVLIDWNEVMTATVHGQPPPVQNRVAAITSLAVFEAVNSIAGDYEPYLHPLSAMHGASAEAAVVAAAHGVLANYFPDSAATLDAARTRSLAAIAEGPAKNAGIAAGESTARAMIAARMNDGSEVPEFHSPDSSNPGEWQPTPDCPPEGGVFVHFRNVTPFGIRRGDQFRSDPPPALTSRRYAKDYREVMAVGARESRERSPEQADVVRFYAALSDAPLWNAILRQVVRQVARQAAAERVESLMDNARAFALLNMALSDAGVAVLDTKYHYNFWRPETAIRDGDRDGNPATDPDPSFAPFIVAPCFPGYPSGHGTTSYAAREVIERIYGRGPHSITLTVADLPGAERRYRTLKDITDDVDDARVYGGIHFRFEQEEAAEQGRRLGAHVYKHNLRGRRGSDCRGCGDDE